MNLVPTVLLSALLPMVLGFGLDWLLGDPHWLYHPVRLIGRFIEALETLLRALLPASPAGERCAGILLAVLVPLFTMTAVGILQAFAWKLHVVVWLVAETLLSYFLLATRSLQVESMAVCHKLEAGDLPAARSALSRIVGRDTAQLQEGGIVCATVETVAENASDGVVAPLLYLALGTSLLGWGYKAVNTLDSMVGYRNNRYRYFGTASAKLDDVLNYIPARLTALSMVVSGALCGFDAANALAILRRDGGNHPSPNSGRPEAACAGALGIQLGGGGFYGGVWSPKPTIGDARKEPEPGDIRRACRLMQITALLLLFLFIILKGTVLALLLHIYGG